MKKTPSKLYKYKTINSTEDLDRFVDILKNKEIYIPTRTQLNDPLEGAGLHVDMEGCMGLWLYDASRMITPRTEEVLDKFRILSITEHERSPQMWAHYAGNYSGACIEFSTSGFLSDAKPVKYTSHKNFVTINYDDQRAAIAQAKKSYYFKSLGWKYEKEFRLLVDSTKRFIQFSPEEITAVHIGHNMHPAYRDYIIETCLQCNIPVYITWYSARDYQLYLIEAKAITECLYGGGDSILNYEKNAKYRPKLNNTR